jgi:DNA helicase HerA-like ATPase
VTDSRASTLAERNEIPPAVAAAQLGLVLGSEDATPLNFWFAVTEGTKVQLDDIVYIEVADPEEGSRIRFYGVVDQVRRRLEGVQFDGDTELVAQGLVPAHVSYAAHVITTRVEPEEFIPPGPGDPVFAAAGEDLDRALFYDAMEDRLPAGVLRNGSAAYLNLAFVDGRKGGHVNISGISGVATKTSYALFLLYSLFNARKESGSSVLPDPHAAKALVFNVKGKDLFYLDQPNRRFSEEEGQWMKKTRNDRTRYDICGLPTGPFQSCEIRAPAVATLARGGDLLPEGADRQAIQPYCWTLHDFAIDRLLPFALTDRDAMTNLGFLVAHVVERLHRVAESQKGPWLQVEAFRDEAAELGAIQPLDASDVAGSDFMHESRKDELRGKSDRLETFADLVDFLEYKLLLQGQGDGDDRGGDRAWYANQPKGTREALIRRLRGASKYLNRLVRGDLPARQLAKGRIDILESEKQLHVIDIHSLAPLAQMFTVGVLLRQVFERKEAGDRGKVFVVLDELNKYAPAEGDSPIKEVMLDIAERGRSLGVILIGAQQTASEVERRVVSNAAVRVSGRLDAAEAERSEYRYMPGSVRSRTTILTPGTMVLHQPDVPTPMLVTFPFPAWATRAEELDHIVTDDDFNARL